MADGVGDKKGRVRPPYVHITYEVFVDGAEEVKELPFVVGVLADLSGNPKESLPKLKERKFVTIDRDNFDAVLAGMKPRVSLKVDDKLTDGGSALAVELEFKKLEDFDPEAIARQVAPMRKLLEMRGQLKDLLSRTEGNDRLEEMLEEIAKSEGLRKKADSAAGTVLPKENSEA